MFFGQALGRVSNLHREPSFEFLHQLCSYLGEDWTGGRALGGYLLDDNLPLVMRAGLAELVEVRALRTAV